MLGNFTFRREFLEIVEIRFKNESEETVNKVIATLGTLVNTIGKIIIVQVCRSSFKSFDKFEK